MKALLDKMNALGERNPELAMQLDDLIGCIAPELQCFYFYCQSCELFKPSEDMASDDSDDPCIDCEANMIERMMDQKKEM